MMHHELDVLAADFFHELHRGGRAAAGGEHGIDDDDVALGNVGRHLEVILHGLKRLRVAEQADVADLDVRHHGDHAVDHAETGAEDRHDGQLLAGDVLAVRRGDRGLHVDLLEREVARGLEHISMAISEISSRNSLTLVFLSRRIESLCWISGWSKT